MLYPPDLLITLPHVPWVKEGQAFKQSVIVRLVVHEDVFLAHLLFNQIIVYAGHLALVGPPVVLGLVFAPVPDQLVHEIHISPETSVLFC